MLADSKVTDSPYTMCFEGAFESCKNTIFGRIQSMVAPTRQQCFISFVFVVFMFVTSVRLTPVTIKAILDFDLSTTGSMIRMHVHCT